MPASVSAVRTVDTCRWDVGGFVSSATRRPVSGASVRASTLRTGPCAEGTTEDMGLLRSMSPPRCEQNTAVLSSILRSLGRVALDGRRMTQSLSAPVEVTVDRGPADTELHRNLRDGVRPVPVERDIGVDT